MSIVFCCPVKRRYSLSNEICVREKELVLNVDFAGDVHPILVGDQLRVKQILLNLIGNAVKFPAKGSIAISVNLLEQHDVSI